MFADDAKIYRAVNCTDDDRSLKQVLTIWKNGLKSGNFSAKKCKCVHFRKANVKHEYTTGNKKLETMAEDKDLVVIIDDTLKFR